MKIEEEHRGAVTVLRPVGPLTHDGAESFGQRATEAAGTSMGRVVIDASRISYMDSVGVEQLLDISEGLAQSGQQLKLCSSNSNVRETLLLVGLSQMFEFYDDVNTAVRSFL